MYTTVFISTDIREKFKRDGDIKRENITYIVDGNKLEDKIKKVLKEFSEKNIELISIFPISSINSSIEWISGYQETGIGGYGGGYTSGVILIGKGNE